MVSVSYLIKANQPSFRHHSILIFICLPCVLRYLRYVLTRSQTGANSAQLWYPFDTRKKVKTYTTDPTTRALANSPGSSQPGLQHCLENSSVGHQFALVWGWDPTGERVSCTARLWAAFPEHSIPQPRCLPSLCRSTASPLPARCLQPPQQLSQLLFVQAMWI